MSSTGNAIDFVSIMLAKPTCLVALALYNNDFPKANQILEVSFNHYILWFRSWQLGCAVLSMLIMVIIYEQVGCRICTAIKNAIKANAKYVQIVNNIVTTSSF